MSQSRSQQSPNATDAPKLQQRKVFEQADIIEWQELAQPNSAFTEQVEQLPQQALKPRRLSGLTRLALIALAVGIVTQLLLTLVNAWQQSPWLFGLYSVITTILVCWMLALVAKEWRYLRQLKRNDDGQLVAERLRDSVQMGESAKFIERILVRLPHHASTSIHALKQSLNPDQNDAEQLRLFETIVLSERDAAARAIVRKYALQSSLILAVSPFALLDMALVLWRNQAMINEIAACYGIELGYWSRIRLIRGIFWNIVYAGTTELMTDFGSQMLSMEMTGKLSTRLAQGLGGGLLTARLGLQAMRLCRPMKFTLKNAPSLTKLHMELLSELRSRMGSAKTPEQEKTTIHD
ncbi:TIGR01620 family protein [Shewanella avicenniae]|uniref:TIGR01620 family protein n=1 Tax=Shewanella avicenniae TaxID=2814294 RepID=A0ABX7QU06_9GAMM|nr:TIGR01620 family protein [Shewanella avicenniae]QSX34914.1 TIGR01620 family protein [Shewanella avicenniae]